MVWLFMFTVTNHAAFNKNENKSIFSYEISTYELSCTLHKIFWSWAIIRKKSMKLWNRTLDSLQINETFNSVMSWSLKDLACVF